ncbi:hypothetical protein WICPIJ_006420 [Wickerhamomyces pijperi]|uniref:Activator of Hsp90 ATPase AHSA1-like N-terminal domain-containing protein n=1 Tax=Wickerhamomyces pijperi TaxID=599730 RepID=A0A9P8TLE7_WICPI|nr:hypothetical protein WICPIJ_006420 [Wickerhamomyces pijperi]
MVVNNPNNWHWTSLNALPWTKNYFTEALIEQEVSASNDTQTVKITNIPSIEGDVEVSQRKGKVISLFDIKMALHWEGKIKEVEEEVKGSITIPEIAYDTDEDEFQFEISVFNENSKNVAIKEVIRKNLIPKLRVILGKFGKDLLEINGAEIQLPADQVQSNFTKANQVASGTSSGKSSSVKSNTIIASSSTSSSNSSTPVPSSLEPSKAPKYNTSTLHFEPTFNTTAEQLYITYLTKNRIGAWARSEPIFEGDSLTLNSEFSLFGGNISGKIIDLEPFTRIRQLWRLNSWKAGHYAELEFNFYQGDSETKMNVLFKGIPIGQEEVVQGNFEDYYVRNVKITFGFGAVL